MSVVGALQGFPGRRWNERLGGGSRWQARSCSRRLPSNTAALTPGVFFRANRCTGQERVETSIPIRSLARWFATADLAPISGMQQQVGICTAGRRGACSARRTEQRGSSSRASCRSSIDQRLQRGMASVAASVVAPRRPSLPSDALSVSPLASMGGQG